MSKDLILMIEEFINNCSGSNLKILKEISNFIKHNTRTYKIILNNYLNNIDKYGR